MHPHLKSLLVKAGCDPHASDDDAQKFYDGMSADKKGEVDGALAAMMDGGGGVDDLSEKELPPPPGNHIDLPATLSAQQLASVASAVIAALGATNVDAATVARLVGKTGAADKGTDRTADNGDTTLAVEGKRVTQITQLGAMLKVKDESVRRCIGANMTVEAARVALLKEVHETAKPLATVSVGQDRQMAALSAAIPQAILLRAGVDAKTMEKHGEKIHEAARGLAGLRVKGMFQRYLAALGCTEVYEFGDAKLAECLGPRGLRRHVPKVAALAETTSDFANITLDAQNKSLRFFYLDAKRTWPIWAEKKFAPDFKTVNRVVLSAAPSMKSRTEGGELQYGTLTDSKETYVLGEYAVGLRFSRRLLINDDLDAFASVPRLQANAAARLEDDTAYAIITANANMADGGALFNATTYTVGGTGHQNYTASDAAPSVTTLQTGATKIKKQKDLANVARLELEPKFLLVPSSIEEQTKELIGSKTLIATYTGGSGNPVTTGDNNPFFGRYQVVGSTRLDDTSTTAWFLFADYRDGQVNTIEVCFLTDEPEPVIRQETDFDSEDVKMLCRHTMQAKAIDFRGLYKSNGA